MVSNLFCRFPLVTIYIRSLTNCGYKMPPSAISLRDVSCGGVHDIILVINSLEKWRVHLLLCCIRIGSGHQCAKKKNRSSYFGVRVLFPTEKRAISRILKPSDSSHSSRPLPPVDLFSRAKMTYGGYVIKKLYCISVSSSYLLISKISIYSTRRLLDELRSQLYFWFIFSCSFFFN